MTTGTSKSGRACPLDRPKLLKRSRPFEGPSLRSGVNINHICVPAPNRQLSALPKTIPSCSREHPLWRRSFAGGRQTRTETTLLRRSDDQIRSGKRWRSMNGRRSWGQGLAGAVVFQNFRRGQFLSAVACWRRMATNSASSSAIHCLPFLVILTAFSRRSDVEGSDSSHFRSFRQATNRLATG